MILTLKLLSGSLLWFCHTGSRLCIFSAATERSALENIDQSQRMEFWEGFQWAFSKLLSNSKKQIKASTFRAVKSFWNTLKIISAYWLKCLDLQTQYPSRDTVPLKEGNTLTQTQLHKQHPPPPPLQLPSADTSPETSPSLFLYFFAWNTRRILIIFTVPPKKRHNFL